MRPPRPADVALRARPAHGRPAGAAISSRTKRAKPTTPSSLSTVIGLLWEITTRTRRCSSGRQGLLEALLEAAEAGAHDRVVAPDLQPALHQVEAPLAHALQPVAAR